MSGNVTLPHHRTVQGMQNRTITIHGTTTHNPDRFALDLRTSRGDLALHINPRFKEPQVGQVVVRNSEIQKKWGQEERTGNFPFRPGQPFTMEVRCTDAGYNVRVDNRDVFQYRHRYTNLHDITNITLHGDLATASVMVTPP